jgi:hypothetical protein
MQRAQMRLGAMMTLIGPADLLSRCSPSFIRTGPPGPFRGGGFYAPSPGDSMPVHSL